jgi:glucose-1-phosphate cytidylyltransferase
MKAVILAGGYGTRISEETNIKPKPMVNIGEQPILWHIMKIYSTHGIHEFIICCGYKGEMIKQYFANYFLNYSDITFDISKNSYEVHRPAVEPWKVTLVDTGEKTMTGGRIRRVKDYIGGETFCLTYGDGVSNVDITKLIHFHKEQGVLATLTAIQPPGRFGVFNLDEGQTIIPNFREKQWEGQAWINGGFFVLEPQVIDYIENDATVWEQDPMQQLSRQGQLAAYRHEGFWQNMDTLRDKRVLEELWNSDSPPWKIW